MGRLKSLFLGQIKRIFSRRFTIDIYTDGSCKNGVGTWAYVIFSRGVCIGEKSGYIRRTGSNFMEFQAAIEALNVVPDNSEITLFSDSRILIDSMNNKKWPKAFLAQIDSLNALAYRHKMTWRWVKAHNGNRLNERCDELCTLARKR